MKGVHLVWARDPIEGLEYENEVWNVRGYAPAKYNEHPRQWWKGPCRVALKPRHYCLNLHAPVLMRRDACFFSRPHWLKKKRRQWKKKKLWGLRIQKVNGSIMMDTSHRWNQKKKQQWVIKKFYWSEMQNFLASWAVHALPTSMQSWEESCVGTHGGGSRASFHQAVFRVLDACVWCTYSCPWAMSTRPGDRSETEN